MQQTIRLADAEHPISFGMAALYAYEQWRGHSVLTKFAELTEGNPSISLVVDIAYVGLKEGARKARLPFKLSPEDVAELINLDAEIIAKVMQCFSDSFPKVEGTDLPNQAAESDPN